MHIFKVLGSGCKRCAQTAELIENAIKTAGADATVEKVEDVAAIMAYGVMSTPGVVLDDKVVHQGGLPKQKQIDAWLAGLHG